MNLTVLLNFESNFVRTLSDLELNRVVTNSLREIIESFFLQVALSMVLTVSCTYDNSERYFKVITQDFYGIKYMHLQLIYVNASRPQRVEGPRLHNMILVDSLEGFLNTDIANYTAKYDTNEYYYIFLQQYDALIPHDMQAIFEYCWKYQLIHCNIQIQSAQKRISMFTYFPYTAEHCGAIVPVEINVFHEKHGWQHKDYFPAKLRNFYHCPLRLAVRDLPPFLRMNNDSGDQLTVGGFEGHLMDEIADYLNFTLEFVVITVDDRTFNYCCGLVGFLLNHKIDIGIGYYRIRSVMEDFSTFTFPHYMSSVVHGIFLNAHNLTTFEILSYPFGVYTWLCTLITFCSTILAAEMLWKKSKFRSRKNKLHRRGRQKFLSLNSVFATTLGISLISEPHNLQDRLLFSATLWTSFLLRSMYAALLYSLFRDNIHTTLPQTADDLLRLKYVGVMNNFMHNELLRIDNVGGYEHMRKIIFNSSNDYIAYPYLGLHGSERLVAPSTREFLIHYGTANHQPGMFRILSENIINQHVTMYVIKHSFLLHQLNDAIMRVDESGLTHMWRYRELDDRYFRSMHLYGQKLISQSDLWAIYLVVALVQLLALGIFSLELLSKRCAKLQQFFK